MIKRTNICRKLDTPHARTHSTTQQPAGSLLMQPKESKNRISLFRRHLVSFSASCKETGGGSESRCITETIGDVNTSGRSIVQDVNSNSVMVLQESQFGTYLGCILRRRFGSYSVLEVNTIQNIKVKILWEKIENWKMSRMCEQRQYRS